MLARQHLKKFFLRYLATASQIAERRSQQDMLLDEVRGHSRKPLSWAEKLSY